MLETCEACKKLSSLSYCEFRQTTGVLVYSNTELFSGKFCRECMHRIFAQAMKRCWLFGWWSLSGPASTITCIIQNIAWRKKGLQGFASPRSARSADQLPWGHLIGAQAPAGVGDVPLTWHSGIGVLSLMAMLIFLMILGVESCGNSNHTAEQSAVAILVSQIGIGSCLLIIVLCLLWHRYAYLLQSTIPDLLSELFPSPMIYQFHGVQLVGIAFQRENSIRLVLGVQNVCKIPVDFTCAINNTNDRYSLASKLGSMDVAMYKIDLPFNPPPVIGRMRLALEFTVHPKYAPKVRHASRISFLSRTRQDLLFAAMLAGGHLQFGSGSNPQEGIVPMTNAGEFNLVIHPSDPSSEQCSTNISTWETVILGTMQDLTEVDKVIHKLAQGLVLP